MLKCIFCYFDPQAPGGDSTAHFVVDGQSVCKQHIQLVRRSKNFTDGYTKMIEEAGKRIHVTLVDEHD